MRPLVASKGEGAHKGQEPGTPSRRKAPQAASSTAPSPTAPTVAALAPTPESSEQRATDASMLNSEPSFEMLATMAEAELVDEKKALQRRTSELEREAGVLRMRAARVARSHARRRQQRRLQQVGVIAARMHEELQRCSGAQTPQTPLSARREGSDAIGTATPVESVSAISPVTQQSTDGPPSAGLLSAARSAAGRSSLASSSMGKVSASSYRAQQINCQIKALSRRFVMRRDMR